MRVSVLALQLKRSAHSKEVLDDSLITVDTTLLDQHKVYYCTITLICHIAKVKTVLSAHSMADVIPFLGYLIFPSNPRLQ